MADLNRAADSVHDALNGIVRTEKAAIVTRWVVLAEVVDEDGNVEMWSMCSPGLSMWDRLGMVEFHSRTIRPAAAEDDDG